jgi:pilus assembly protein FimV
LYKIGSYLRAEGAYAHPNAIKLLLSFFYNFEKIISSETITGDAISSMLKSDVRKFKILQYQINQKEPVQDRGEPVQGDELTITIDEEGEAKQPECEPLTCLKATILGLEWEVTDKGLHQFNQQIGDIRAQFAGNKSAQILIQGLQALGAYITDERADAHPEAFSMLHSFYEGLELLLDEKNIDEEEKQSILVDRVNRLNALKVMIAEEKEAQTQESEDSLVDEILAPEKEDLVEEDQEEPLEALAEIDEPVVTDDSDFLDPDAIMPVEDTIADNLIEEELRVGGGIAALHDEETPDIEEELSISEEVVEEELDLFFVDDENEAASSAADTAAESDTADLGLAFTDEDLDVILSEEEAAEGDEELLFSDEDTDAEESALDQLFVEEDETGLAPALAEADEEGGFDENEALESLPETPTDEIDDKLDAFFGLDEEEEPEAENKAVAGAPEKDAGIAPALFDADEEGGFDEHEVAADLEEAPMDEIEDKLDAFFGLDEEESDEIAAATKSGAVEQDELSVLPALADAEEEGGFDEDTAVASLTEEPSAEIEDKLDAFFGLDEEETEQDKEPASVEQAIEEDVMPALADADEEGGFDEDTVVAGLSEAPSPEIEDKLDAFFGLDEEEATESVPDTEHKTPALTAGLAALAAGAVTAASLGEKKESIQSLRKDESLTDEQAILLDLFETALTLLPEGEEQPPAIKDLLASLQNRIEQNETGSKQLLSAVSATLLVVAREVAVQRNRTA